MLKRIFLYFLFIWQVVDPCIVSCQTGFNKLIDIPNILGFDFDDILLINNTLVVRGDAYVDSIQKFGLLIAQFDTNGNVLTHQTLYSELNSSNINTNSPCRFIGSNNKYIIPTRYFDTGNLGIFITDTLGSKLNEIEYYNSESAIFPVKILELNSQYYVFGKVERQNNITDDFILKVDSLGNKIWIKYYGFPDSAENFGDAILNEDQTISISTTKLSLDYTDLPIPHGWIKPWIYTVDTSGQIISEWLGNDRDERTLAGGPIYRFANGDWLIISREFKFLENGSIARSPTITKLSSNYDIIWKHTLTDFIGFRDDLIELVYDTTNNEFVSVGHKVEYYSDNDGAVEVWAVKFNSEGEIIWNVSDTVYWDPINKSMHLTSGLEISKSGSIYVVGSLDHFSNPSRYYGWLAKITPDGCMETLCKTNSVISIPVVEVRPILFPNPCGNYFEIDMPSYSNSNDFRIEIFNFNGTRLRTFVLVVGNNKINIDLNPGIYFYSIINKTKFVISNGRMVVQ